MKDVDILRLFDPETHQVWTNEDPEWHEVRSHGLGGSDMGTIVGINHFKSPYTLWMEKKGLTQKEEAGEAAFWGNELEPVVARRFATITGLALVQWHVTFRSKEHPFLLANVDRLIVEPSEQFPAGTDTVWWGEDFPPGVIGVYEGKTAGVYAAEKWDNDAIPDGYLLQGQHYLSVLGLPWVKYGCLITGQKVEIRHMDADPDLQADLFVVGQKFWQSLEDNVPPPPDASDSTTTTLKQIQRPAGKRAKLDEDFRGLWLKYDLYNRLAKRVDKKKTEAYNRVLEAMGDAELAGVGNELLCTYKGYDKETFDAKRFAEENPVLHQQYLKKSAVRTLRAASKKAKAEVEAE